MHQRSKCESVGSHFQLGEGPGAFSVIAKTDGLFAALDKRQEQEIGVLFVGFGFLFLGC